MQRILSASGLVECSTSSNAWVIESSQTLSGGVAPFPVPRVCVLPRPVELPVDPAPETGTGACVTKLLIDRLEVRTAGASPTAPWWRSSFLTALFRRWLCSGHVLLNEGRGSYSAGGRNAPEAPWQRFGRPRCRLGTSLLWNRWRGCM